MVKRGLLSLGLAMLVAVTAAAQTRVFLVAQQEGWSLRIGTVTPGGSLEMAEPVPLGAIEPVSVVAGDGGGSLYVLLAHASRVRLARVNLRTGAAYETALDFQADSTLAVDPFSPGVYVVTPATAVYVRDGGIEHEIPLPPLPAPPLHRVSAVAAGGRLFVARRTSVAEGMLTAVDLRDRLVLASRTLAAIEGLNVSADGSRVYASARIPASTMVLDGASLTTLAEVPRRINVRLVDASRGVVGELNDGRAFGGPGFGGPSGLRLFDHVTLTPLRTLNAGMLDGSMTIAALQPSPQAPFVILSQKVFPGYAGGPREPRVDVLDGSSGRITAAMPLGTAPIHQPYLTGMSVPGPPRGLVATVTGHTVDLAWQAAAHANGYVLEVGSTPGHSDLLLQRVARDLALSDPNVPPGTFYVRLRAFNDIGVGPASNEVRVVVP